ncbi:MAG: hypothetical protein R2713_23405 [Ilumatobacteraceae bacterium]
MPDFTVMQHRHLALAQGDATTLAEALRVRMAIPGRPASGPQLLRNSRRAHARSVERRRTRGGVRGVRAGRGHAALRARAAAPAPGDVRRRRRSARMAYSLLFSLPGASVLFYGEEIGMGRNLEVPGRRSVRTPMQWTSEPSAGFSTARPSKLRRRPPSAVSHRWR